MTKLPKHPFDRARGRRLMGAWTGLALAVCVLTAPALAKEARGIGDKAVYM